MLSAPQNGTTDQEKSKVCFGFVCAFSLNVTKISFGKSRSTTKYVVAGCMVPTVAIKDCGFLFNDDCVISASYFLYHC